MGEAFDALIEKKKQEREAYRGGAVANANEMDFFGEGLADQGEAAPGGGTSQADKGAWERANKAAKPRDLIPGSIGDQTSGAPLRDGNVWDDVFSDKTKDTYNYYRDIRDPNNVTDFFNAMGEDAGVTHAGDALIGDFSDNFRISNPLEFNPLDRVTDPNTGLGTTADGQGGQPIGASMDPGLRDAMTPGIGQMGGDALDRVLSAIGGMGGPDVPIDASGADRGGMGLGGAYSVQLDAAAQQGANARSLGSDVLSGKVAGPNAADSQRQGDALDRALAFKPQASDRAAKSAANFAAGPKAANDVLGKVNAFAQGPEGPSSASLLQDEASQKAMSDVLSVSRSGRARDAGSQARAANVAQGEIAGMGVDNARNAALLRNKEANDARSQQLSALGLSGDLAQGLDSTKLGALSLQGDLAKSRDANNLGALNLGSDIASQMRGAGIQERGQSLDFMQGQEQIGAGLTGDVLKTIPALENIRHQDQFELTPQQKIAAAKLGGAPDKTATDYVTALLGDVLGAAF
jgi:hypothetical protein